MTKTKILVVDDDRQVLQAIRSDLEKLGYEVATAEDGSAALKRAQSMSPDLVVLDLNVPDCPEARSLSVDGIEVRWPQELSARIEAILRRTGKALPCERGG